MVRDLNQSLPLRIYANLLLELISYIVNNNKFAIIEVHGSELSIHSIYRHQQVSFALATIYSINGKYLHALILIQKLIIISFLYSPIAKT